MEKGIHRTRIALALLLATLGIVVPYLVAYRISPAGTVFAGFLINPIDGFSYLTKMRQGYDGSWLFQLAYTSEPGASSLIFVFYIALGHLSRVLHLPMIVVYHVARVVLSLGFFLLLCFFHMQIFEEDRLVWSAFLFSLFGSGLGWIAAMALQRQTIDLWVAEAFPFLSAYTNPHFPLAAAGFLGAILLVYRAGPRKWWHYLLASFCGFTLGMVLPFTTIPLFLILTGWLVWELARRRAWATRGWLSQEPLTLLALAAGALPWLLYDFGLSLSHPVISQWNAQNLTPSPPLLETTLGFGIFFALSVCSLPWRPWRSGRAGRLLTTWFVLGFALLYLPLPFQRRMSMALFIPMAALSAWWLGEVLRSGRAYRLISTFILVLSLPSLLLVILAGVSGAGRGEPAVVYSQQELQAYKWIGDHLPSGDLVLAEPDLGNRLPAFADVRVLYGHPFETPNADFWREEVSSLLNGDAPAQVALDRLSVYSVDWVLIDTSASAPVWSESLPAVAAFNGLQLLEGITE